MTLTLAFSVLANFGLVWLWMKSIREATRERYRAEVNERTIRELEKQIENAGLVRTDDDVLVSLRNKAANKRLSESKGDK